MFNPPWYYKALAALGLIVGIWFVGDLHGSNSKQAEWDADTALRKSAEQDVHIQADAITLDAGLKFADTVQTIYIKGATITKEIPKYVTVKADANCTIPVGFVSVWNAAATGGALPDAPGQSNDAPSGVALSTVADTTAAGFTMCRATAEQLTQLQVWVKAQAALYGPPAKP